MRPTRTFLRLITGNAGHDGPRHPKILKACVEDYRPTFSEFFALIILMHYYFYPDDFISPVIREFYRLYKPKFVGRWPRESEKQRLILILSNAYACSTNLVNESGIETLTKNFESAYHF